MQIFHGQIFVFTIFTLFHGHLVLFHGHFTLFHGHFEVKSFSRPKRFFTAKDPCGQRTPKVRPNGFPGSSSSSTSTRPSLVAGTRSRPSLAGPVGWQVSKFHLDTDAGSLGFHYYRVLVLAQFRDKQDSLQSWGPSVFPFKTNAELPCSIALRTPGIHLLVHHDNQWPACSWAMFDSLG